MVVAILTFTGSPTRHTTSRDTPTRHCHPTYHPRHSIPYILYRHLVVRQCRVSAAPSTPRQHHDDNPHKDGVNLDALAGMATGIMGMLFTIPSLCTV